MFTPGNDERKLAKVTTLGADVVVLDLEDAVADAEKVAARATARAALDGYADATAFIRVNPVDSGLMEDDVAAVVGPGLAGIMLPKVEDPAALPRIDRVISTAERTAGLPVGLHAAARAGRDRPRHRCGRRHRSGRPGAHGDAVLRAG